jgi:2-dehydropantoate 2-reductase
MPEKKQKVAIIGAGAIGGVTAALLKSTGYDLEVVCKHRHLAETIRSRGFRITGKKGAHQIRMDAVAAISDLSEPLDLVFLATKAADCILAARDLLPKLAPDAGVVSLQNGICEHALAEVLGKERVIGCVVGWGASNNGDGALEVTSAGEFVIGNLEGPSHPRLAQIQRILTSVNPTRISDNIIGELYAKLIINACINSLGVIGGVRLGALLADKNARSICIRLMREALAVAEAMGIRVEPAGGGKLDYYTFLAGKGPMNDMKRHLVIRMIGYKYRRIKSSSLQSLERGHRTEVDYLNGYICANGRAQQVPTPVNEAVRHMVKAIENNERKMGMANFGLLLRAG